ncbi:MAG: DUF5671 domain-containing protein [Patescibacteria group bacterium]
MEPTIQTKPKAGVRDFFINLGAFVAMYTVIVALLNLLFTIINKAYPQITGYYTGIYSNSSSISFPVATLIIFFPLFVVLMRILQSSYVTEPEKKTLGAHKWLVYITLFVSGLTLAGDLVTILYYFIDGQDITAAFGLKVLAVFVVAFCVFLYFVSDLRGRLTAASRKMWISITTVIVLGSIIWGFAVLGSPRTQRLMRYDDQKVSDLQSLNSSVQNYYSLQGVLPESIVDISNTEYYYAPNVDSQTKKPYEYIKTSATAYQICAEFNKEAKNNTESAVPRYGGELNMNIHPAGRYCFSQTINPHDYQKPVPVQAQ